MIPSLRGLWRKIGARWAGRKRYRLTGELQRAIHDLAADLGRAEDEVAGELLARGLGQRRRAESVRQAWPTLSGRQRQVAGLLRQDLTYRQIAARLGISPQTARLHARLALAKLGLRSRAELIQALGEQRSGEKTGERG